MCKRCHGVKTEILKTCNWSYRSWHFTMSNADVESRMLIVRLGHIKSYRWAQKSPCSQILVCECVYSILLKVLGRSATWTVLWSAAPRACSLCNVEWGALLPPLPPAALPALVQGYRQDDGEDDDHKHHYSNDEEHFWKTKGPSQLWQPESHLSAGRMEGVTTNYTSLLLCTLKFLSSALSTTHFD